MIEIKGLYCTAKVFTDQLEESAAEQIRLMCDQPFAEGCKCRVMPDVHAGAGCTIGTTMTIRDKVVPNLVGVDIGCGMEIVKLAADSLDFALLDCLIRERVPAGYSIREVRHPYLERIDLSSLRCDRINRKRAERSIGTLGGGNHFIEVDRDDEGGLYLIIHSGSRHLGSQIAEYYQDQAYCRLNGSSGREIRALIARLKEAGREQEIQSSVKELKRRVVTDTPRELAWCEEDLLEDYLADMRVVQQFAELNRQAIAEEILRGMKLEAEWQFTTIHNYIDLGKRILRKGAVSAEKGERLLIPINMRDGSLICVGKGNEDWNCSAPHGAGRLMSRGAARERLNVEDFQKSMEGIYTTSVSKATLDESPDAYKPIGELLRNIGDTVDVVKHIRPVYNFKAG